MRAISTPVDPNVLGEDLAMQMRFGEHKDALILIGRYPWLGGGCHGRLG